MTSGSRQRSTDRIELLMERASEALSSTRWFEAEALAGEALAMARRASDFALMARICLPLQEARRNRLAEALDIGQALGVGVLDSAIDERRVLSPGCWLVAPPLVGADARRIREAALRRADPVAILCREPRTKAGRWPVVAVGSVVIRVHLDLPPGGEVAPPPMSWFIWAMEALGDAAIASAALEVDPIRHVDALLARLDAHPDHEKLHQALLTACREAHLRGGSALEPGGEPPHAARGSALEEDDDFDDPFRGE